MADSATGKAAAASSAGPTEYVPSAAAHTVPTGAAEVPDALSSNKPSQPTVSSISESTNLNGPAQAIPERKQEKPASDASKPVPPVPVHSEDTEMKDAPKEVAPAKASEAAPETNGAAATASATTPKGRRKSGAGVPEHKGKTLKKKQSKAKITNLDAKPGEYYFARLRSYPPWPSMVCDEEMLPTTLLKTRPITAALEDGTYREPYADDGKKIADRTFPVMFLFTNEFAWIPNTDLTPLNPEDCKDVSEKGKSKSLLEAYKVATEHHDIQYFKDMLEQHAAAVREDEEIREAKEAEKVEKSQRKKRKSEAKLAKDDDVEMEDAGGEPKKSSKKRKKDADSDDEETEKPAKTPKTTKLKLTTNKTPTTTEKKSKEKAAKPKSERKKKAAAPVSDEETESPDKEEEPVLDPVEARKAREKEVLFLRHKLQKGFLSRDQAPLEEEMPQMATYIKKLEGYGDTLEVGIIRSTKINKVLKALIKLNTIPKDEEFHFRERSVKLLAAWNHILGAEPPELDQTKKDDKASPATTNGIHKEGEEKVDEKVEESKDQAKAPIDTADKASSEVNIDAQPKQSATDTVAKENVSTAPTPAPPKTEAPKPDHMPVVESIEKAPESAAAASEVAGVVKTTE